MIVDTTIRKGIEILHTIRGYITNIVKAIPYDNSLVMIILMASISLYLGFLLTKRFVTRPYAVEHLPWYLIISSLIFLILNYL
jgi:hypothetical protein